MALIEKLIMEITTAENVTFLPEPSNDHNKPDFNF